MRNPVCLFSVGLFLLTLAVPVQGEDGLAEWAQFRGPNGNGFVSTQHPSRWSDAHNVAWSREISGGGWSSPIATAERIFLTTAVSSDGERPKGFGEGVSSMRSFYQSGPPQQPLSFEIHCLDVIGGDTVWTKQIALRKPPYKIHPSNSYATESPVTDGRHVYAYFAAIGTVACVDLEGELVWKRELGAFPTSNDFGTGSSLALLDGKVFVQCDNEQQSFVCALEAGSGREIWRVNRDGGTSWSSPVIWRNRVRTELVVCGSGEVTAFEPTTGDVLWRLGGMRGAFSASPTFDNERLYLGNSGRNSRGPLVAINAGAAGELTLDDVGSGIAWIQEASAPSMCSPVVASGRLYVLSRGILSCHDAATGDRLYRQRLKDASSVTSSLWACDDKVFALNESGLTAVVKVGDEFELLASNEMSGLFWSTPSVVGESLLLRGAKVLFCVRSSSDLTTSELSTVGGKSVAAIDR